MATSINGRYTDNLRCELIHLQSESNITTDAPIDNNGKGEKFSPTDLLAAGLGSCMLTIIAIRARDKNINIGKPSFKVKKHMKTKPRAIDKIEVEITYNESLSEIDKKYLEEEAKKCPVAMSLNSDIDQQISFIYN